MALGSKWNSGASVPGDRRGVGHRRRRDRSATDAGDRHQLPDDVEVRERILDVERRAEEARRLEREVAGHRRAVDLQAIRLPDDHDRRRVAVARHDLDDPLGEGRLTGRVGGGEANPQGIGRGGEARPDLVARAQCDERTADLELRRPLERAAGEEPGIRVEGVAREQDRRAGHQGRARRRKEDERRSGRAIDDRQVGARLPREPAAVGHREGDVVVARLKGGDEERATAARPVARQHPLPVRAEDQPLLGEARVLVAHLADDLDRAAQRKERPAGRRHAHHRRVVAAGVLAQGDRAAVEERGERVRRSATAWRARGARRDPSRQPRGAPG